MSDKITISVIKADMGGYVGHSSLHTDLLKAAEDRLSNAASCSLLKITLEQHRSALYTIIRSGHDGRGGPTCRSMIIFATIARKSLQYFFHSRNLRRSRLLNVPTVRVIRSKS